ncbi:hypothetical protein D9611_011256 [Ephemerocybe angulata]|uniref:Uncharacterized protein n=1 Tax=Ephemerocybe angulata TaxID=980116 RepID=A0A8H5F1M0_9AGAR|nr:hypothetical protein D9611_011256 [Tulosesus angulatus]
MNARTPGSNVDAIGTIRGRPNANPFGKSSASCPLPPSGVFGRTQVRGVSPPVSSAWDATNTRSSTAGASEHGTRNTPPSSSGTMGSSDSGHLEIQSASTGSWSGVATAVRTTIATFARAAVRPLMELRRALEERTRNPASLYRVDEVERLLRCSGLAGRYPLVVDGLCHGFRVGFPSVPVTQVPENKPSVEQYRAAFEAAVAKELDKGRYIGPASRADMEIALGHFQCSPLSIIPKAMVGKYRIIQNFSFPLSPSAAYPLPSINSHTDASTFPCTWGTFASVAYLVWHLPPGSQMAVRDVTEAYRTIPLHWSQWSATVVGLGKCLFCADTFAAFGARPSGGVFGMVADAFVDLMRWRGMGPITKWADDHIFFHVRQRYLDRFNALHERWRLAVVGNGGERRGKGRVWFQGEVLVDGERAELFEGCEFPMGVVEEGRAEQGADEIDLFSRRLGIRWEESKDQAFAQVGQYIGLVWDLHQRTVALSADKRQKYRDAIVEWRSTPKHALHEVQQLYGRLLHAALVLPAGRAQLTGLGAMLGVASQRPFALRHPPAAVAGDLEWWYSALNAPISRDIGRMFPSAVVECRAYSDASSGVGIGIVIGERWRAWRLLPGWRTLDGEKDIQWAEAVGFELLILAVLRSHPPGTHLRLHGDNRGVVEGWQNFRSRNSAVNAVFKRILTSSMRTARQSASTHNMFLVPRTLLTLLPVVSSHPETSSSQNSTFPPSSLTSSLMLHVHSPPPNASTMPQGPFWMMNGGANVPLESMTTLNPGSLLTTSTSYMNSAVSRQRVERSRAMGRSVDSILRLLCLAEQTLRMWVPLRAQSSSAPSSAVLDVLSQDFVTRGCPGYRRAEADHAPVTEAVILDFIVHCAGRYSSSAVHNYVYGIKAWHTLHRLPWRIPETVLTPAFRAAKRMAPIWAKRSPRDPVTVDTMTTVLAHLDLSVSLNAAVWACMTTTFWSVSHLGEFTVKTQTAFRVKEHVKRSDVRLDVPHGRARHLVTTFWLPSTKTKPEGESTQWAAQEGPCDARAALLNHFAVNNPAMNVHLFSWRNDSGDVRPLTSSAFLKRVNAALEDVGEPPIQGHCLRIGGVLEWLLRGRSFEVVKVMGWWSSDAFLVYIRRQAAILAPYIQAYPVLGPLASLIDAC